MFTPSSRAPFSARPSCILLASAVLLCTPVISRAGFSVRKKVTVPAGESTTLVVQFPKDGAPLSAPSVDTFDNGSASPITITLLAAAPDDANDRHYKIKYGPLTSDEPEAGADLPDLVPNLALYLASNGHTEANPLVTPFVIADSNGNQNFDPTDGSIYSLISNLAGYDTAAAGFTFTAGQLLSTNGSGQVAGLSGITFYTDPAFTSPAANASLLIMGTASESVPEPASLVVAAAGGMALLLRRRARH